MVVCEVKWYVGAVVLQWYSGKPPRLVCGPRQFDGDVHPPPLVTRASERVQTDTEGTSSAHTTHEAAALSRLFHHPAPPMTECITTTCLTRLSASYVERMNECDWTR